MNKILLKNAAILVAQLVIYSYWTLPTAQAVLLDGKQITTAFYFPDQNTIGFGGVPVVTTVGPGVEIAASPQGFPIALIDFSGTSIELDFFRSLVGTVAAFNGWRFYDATDTIPAFTNATLTTSLPGWVVTFDANDIGLNGSGATYFVGSTLRIDLNGAQPPVTAPEPGTLRLTLTLMAIGLASIGYSRCRNV